jgi:hypothetical protein
MGRRSAEEKPIVSESFTAPTGASDWIPVPGSKHCTARIVGSTTATWSHPPGGLTAGSIEGLLSSCRLHLYKFHCVSDHCQLRPP